MEEIEYITCIFILNHLIFPELRPVENFGSWKKIRMTFFSASDLVKYLSKGLETWSADRG